MKNKHLLLVLIGLLVIYIGTKVFSNKGSERNFNSDLVQVDTSSVQEIQVKLPSESYRLHRSIDGWLAEKEGQSVTANAGAVKSMLSTFIAINAKQLVTRNPEKWVNYEVDETTGTLISLLDDSGKELAACIVGRFNFNQQTQAGISYLRLKNSNDVYAIDGFASLSAKQEFNAFRNRQLVSLNAGDLKGLSLFDQDVEIHKLSLRANEWVNENQVVLDSASMQAYIANLSKLTGSKFVDNFDKNAFIPGKKLEIKADNSGPVILTSYMRPGDPATFVINSSQNPDGYFNSDSSGIYKQIFLDLPAK